MTVSTLPRARCIALVGNPNTGKSTLFNALSGLRQRVGNYPGVTVEKKLGRLRVLDQECLLVDLPGTYSLAPRSPDEMVAVDVLLGRRAEVPPPDVILCVVDASNLERNLYLVSQVLELERPTVIALTMVDLAEANGERIDVAGLSRNLGTPVVAIHAQKRAGLEELKQALSATIAKPLGSGCLFPHSFRSVADSLQQEYAFDENGSWPRFLVERLLLDTSGYLESVLPNRLSRGLAAELPAARERCLNGHASLAELETAARHDWSQQSLQGVITRTGPPKDGGSTTDRIDRVLLHPLWGSVVMALTMLVLFQAVFSIAEPASRLIDALTGALAAGVSWLVPQGALESLLTDGIIAGVGGVLVFLPQIFLLFLFIAILEDSGYLARIACLMDRLMSSAGLSGKSFIPLLSSFACAIPGIMATRVIENRRDRLVTILIAPLMTCSARLPVYTLLIAAFIPDLRLLGGFVGLQGLTMFSLYLLGIVAAVLVALVLKRTLLRGETPPFVLELPAYKRPSALLVLRRMAQGGWAFIHGAGTLIVAVTVLVWAAAYYPRGASHVAPSLLKARDSVEASLRQLPVHESSEQETWQTELAQIDHQIQAVQLRQSYLGRAGQWIEPLVKPLGWDWRVGCAVLASFPAREVVVATLGVIYKLGDDEDEASRSLRQTLAEATWEGTSQPVFNIPVALSIMVFFALCAQCASTLAVMKRETNSWRWPIFTFVYMTGLAYVAALVTYQTAIRLPL